MENLSSTATFAFEYIESTDRNIFLTGKAGTGKTTFLKHVRSSSAKNVIVAAPTALAAINADAVTLHSLFQIPFGPLLSVDKTKFRFSNEKKRILSTVHLLIIDEVSMVRPDVLDHIDIVLRFVRDSELPFGGVQLLLIGDLFQLSPVIRDEEWSILKTKYSSVFFFCSQALNDASFVTIEFEKIYRQKDQEFIELLNSVRVNEVSFQQLQKINSQCNFMGTQDVESHIILTSHNSVAIKRNLDALAKITTDPHYFKALVQGDFPADMFPTEEEMVLKVGAQVMFIKNDTSTQRLYYNGKLGKVTKIENDGVFVCCNTDQTEVFVQPQEWTNIKYIVSSENGQLLEEPVGSFVQIPLRSAWCITIHKSQGLTFETAAIDIEGAFAHGQVYVALSRCKSLEGLLLLNPIDSKDIILDTAVVKFTNEQACTKSLVHQLVRDQFKYNQRLALEMFHFSDIAATLERMKLSLSEDSLELNVIITRFNDKIYQVSNKFYQQLTVIDNETVLQQRIKKACEFFSISFNDIQKKIKELIPHLSGAMLNEETTRSTVNDLNYQIERTIDFLSTFSSVALTGSHYHATRKIFEETSNLLGSQSDMTKNDKIKNEPLYSVLIEWRNSLAEVEQVPPYVILSEKVLRVIADKLPITIVALAKIKGMNSEKLERFGLNLLQIVESFSSDEQSSSQHKLF